MALHHHPEGIADQQHVGTGAVDGLGITDAVRATGWPVTAGLTDGVTVVVVVDVVAVPVPTIVDAQLGPAVRGAICNMSV